MPRVGKHGTGDDGVQVYGQGAAHEFLHGFGTFAGHMDHAALVLHKGNRAVRDQQRERNIVQVVGFEGAALESFDPGLSDLFTEFGVPDPLDLRPKLVNRLAHSGAPPI